MVEITPTATAEIERLISSRQIINSSLQLTVKSGGCLGLYYDLEFVSNSLRNSQADENVAFEVNGIELLANREVWQYVEHLQIDYSEDLMGGGFRFRNPRIEKTCGCGISFSQTVAG